ncbi:hypothetical protein [Nocardia sp. CA-290969]|uniref:hypothetical protein n=1 Tax=Nocardia sp. CA-290969 TaxID=3239986 RepID=UPI003D943B46
MSVQVLRFATRPDRIPEVEGAVTELFAAVAAAGAGGIGYTAMRPGGEPEFGLILRGNEANPLPGIPAAREFSAKIAGWTGGPVLPRQAAVPGRYAR